MAGLALQVTPRLRERKIFLITERPLLIGGFRELLERAGIGQEHSIFRPADLPAMIGKLASALVVIDGDSSFAWDGLAQLRESSPHSWFVLWSGQVTPELARAACEAGVHGLISSRLPLAEAAEALLKICQGEQEFRFETEPSARGTSAERLTRREQQVLALVKEGLKNREIAAALRTTQGSVKVYMNRLFRKMGVRSRYELALRARGSSQEIYAAAAGAPFDDSWMFTAQ
jgi:DNA-binding NarL/FixJ family response regulator